LILEVKEAGLEAGLFQLNWEGLLMWSQVKLSPKENIGSVEAARWVSFSPATV
jgi:hypothetical protein